MLTKFTIRNFKRFEEVEIELGNPVVLIGPNNSGKTSAMQALEYRNRPEATAESLVDGWFYTGDGAVMDEDGFVYIQDRLKDMIISGGENVYPAELEEVIGRHPKVLEVGVIGRESEKWGESPVAIVVRSDENLEGEEVLEFCQDKLARFKQPVAVHFIDQLPRNPSGKILKRLLREQFN